MKEFKDKSWEEVSKMQERTLLYSELFPEYGFNFLVIRGPYSYCAYICVPSKHPCAGYDDTYDIDFFYKMHGGLTCYKEVGFPFHEKYEGDSWNEMGKTCWIYGWDYGHAGDALFTDSFDNVLGNMINEETSGYQSKKYSLKEIIDDCQPVIEAFKDFCKERKIEIKDVTELKSNEYKRLIDAILED